MSGAEFSIEQVLPHAAPMLLLDELLDHGEEHVTTRVTITERSMFCDPGQGVPAWVGLEYMAQAVGAFSGIEEARRGIKPTIGLLLGSRTYKCSTPIFRLGAVLSVSANLLLRDENNLVAFQCEIREHGERIAYGDVKAYRPSDVHALVREQSQGQRPR